MSSDEQDALFLLTNQGPGVALVTRPPSCPPLVFVAAPRSVAEPQLRSALSAWAGPNQILPANEKAGAIAFLAEAKNHALKVLSDPRTKVDLAIEANNAAAVPVPGGPAALERARQLRERGAGVGAGVFGPDKKAQDLSSGPGALHGLQATAAQKTRGADAGQGSGTFVKNASAATTAAPGRGSLNGQPRGDGQRRDRRLQGLLRQRSGGQMNKHVISALLMGGGGAVLLAVFAIILMMRNW